MKIPLLADKSMEVAKAYGVLKEDEGIAFRGLFVIDGKQNLRQVCQTSATNECCNLEGGLGKQFEFFSLFLYVSFFFFQVTINDLPVGRDVDETLRLVQAFQFTDEHGEGKVLSGIDSESS